MFILGKWYLGLGVLRHVFGGRYVASVLITADNSCDPFSSGLLLMFSKRNLGQHKQWSLDEPAWGVMTVVVES